MKSRADRFTSRRRRGDASLVMPAALRMRKLTVRIPLYQIAPLKVLAEEGSETVDALLERMLNELAGDERERLASRIPGLAEAAAWPELAAETHAAWR